MHHARMAAFTLAESLATTLITFVVSGFGGAILNRYLSRARPTISITAVGFKGDMVHLSDSAVEASANDAWGSTLQAYVSYQTASERENAASNLILELEKVRSIVDGWLQSSVADPSKTTLLKSELLLCPYFWYEQVGGSTMGSLRRRTMPHLPIPQAEVDAVPEQLDVVEADDGWLVHVGKQSVRFPINEKCTSKEKAQVKLIAESFARGVLGNIRHVLQVFTSECARDINELTRLRDELRMCLSKNAHLVLEVVVTNLGDKPAIITPYCCATTYLGEDAVSLILKAERGTKDVSEGSIAAEVVAKIAALSQQEDTRNGRMFDIPPFLADTNSPPHVSVPGGATQRLIMTSIDPLGENGENLVKHFELGTLTCSLAAKTASNAVVRSSRATFGKELSQQKRALLLA